MQHRSISDGAHTSLAESDETSKYLAREWFVIAEEALRSGNAHQAWLDICSAREFCTEEEYNDHLRVFICAFSEMLNVTHSQTTP